MSATLPADTVKQQRSWLRRRRRVLIVALVLLIVLAVGAEVTWNFSSEVLVLEHNPWSANVTVKALHPGEVILARAEGTLRPGIYGLDWQAGHALMGEVVSSDATSVTRRLSQVSGYLVAGMKVALDSGVYVGDPRQALGLPFANVSIPDELGPMPAWLVPGRGATWAIVVHGINGDPQNGLRIVPTLHRAGLPTLLITYREDFGAPASPDGLHHMGLTEWRDLQAAARYALAHGARRLLLAGYSMGGAVIAQFMEHSPLARSAVAGLLLDAPALDWKGILSFNARKLGLPSFAALPVEWMIGARINADWDSLDALRHPSDFHVPILLFHGTEDKLVPISTSDAFAKELRGWVTYYRVPHAGHTEAWNVDPPLYEQRLDAFLQRIGATLTNTSSRKGKTAASLKHVGKTPAP